MYLFYAPNLKLSLNYSSLNFSVRINGSPKISVTLSSRNGSKYSLLSANMRNSLLKCILNQFVPSLLTHIKTKEQSNNYRKK